MKLTRRSFVQSTALSAASICCGCSAASKAGRPGPAKIIDTHVHFYDPSRPQGVPWPPKNDPLLYKRTLPGDYRALMVPQPVNGVVVVEASEWVEDNQWILDLAAKESLIVGLVGNLLPGTEEFAAHLKRFAANPLFRGIRTRAGSLEAGLNNPAFVRDLRAAADLGLSFDIHSPPAWVAQTSLLARTIPNLRLIVNHVANVTITGGSPPDEWKGLMQTLAGYPQVFMKVSGLVEGSKCSKGDAPENAEFYQPVLETLWNAFGADRLIYGSNWPVSRRFAPLGAVQQIAMNYFATKGQAALDKVFYQNAQIAYQLRKI